MLVLSRKLDEGIVIAGCILVKVLGIERGRVKVGVVAPEDITIARDELPPRDTQEGANSGDG